MFGIGRRPARHFCLCRLEEELTIKKTHFFGIAVDVGNAHIVEFVGED
jgi:hypothetical protein